MATTSECLVLQRARRMVVSVQERTFPKFAPFRWWRNAASHTPAGEQWLLLLLHNDHGLQPTCSRWFAGDHASSVATALRVDPSYDLQPFVSTRYRG